MGWTKEQTSAIYESGKNIIVSAGAGSGKTAVLSERVLEKVKKGVMIDHLLILTFTKAAAEEMKERIRKKIKENNLFEQLNKVDSSFITTFDSFSLSLVKKYHYLLNVKKNLNIIDGNVLNIKTKEILDNIMEEEYSNSDDDLIKLINDFCVKDDTELKKLILSLNNKLNMKYYKEEYLNHYLDNYYSDEFINKSIVSYENLIKNDIQKLDKLLTKLSLIADSDYTSQVISLCKPLLDSTDYQSIKDESLKIVLPRLYKGSGDDVKKIKEEIKTLLDEIIDKTKLSKEELKQSIILTKPYVRKIINIIQRLDMAINNYKEEQDLYDFIDVSKMAIKLVRENENIREEIKNFFCEIMVDEYQDTSDLQEEFINLISNNNLYMVGDIKQSIYRFRNANPHIFHHKYMEYEKEQGGIKIDLLKNFRSREEVLNNINLIFDLIMDDHYGGADYVSSHRMCFGNTSYIEEGMTKQNNNFEIYEYDYDKKGEFTKDEIEAFTIVNDVIKKINNNYQIFDKDKKILRKATYSDFCILTDRSSSFELYKKIFLYFQVPLNIYKDEYLTNSNIFYVIKSIYKLLSILTSTNNKQEITYTFLSIGRSFLFNLPDEYLFDVIKNNRYDDTEIFKIINEILTNIENKSIQDLLDEIIEKFDFYKKLLTINSITDNIIKIDYLYTLADTLNKMGYTYHDFIMFIDNLFDSDENIRFQLNQEDNDSVKMMTIHKSKGLEYPICYFPGLYKEFNTREVKDRINYSNELGIIMPYFDDGLINNYLFSLYKKNYYDEEISEKIRLFYVALTRTKEKMIFVVPKSEKEEDYENNLVSDMERSKYKSFLDILLSIKSKIIDYSISINQQDLKLSKDYNLINNKNIFDNLKKINKEININNNIQIEKVIKKKSHYSKGIHLINKEEKEKMEFGSKMHYYLETLDLKNPNLLDIEEKYKEKINKFLNSSLLKNIQDANIYQEYEFIDNTSNEVKHGIIDLLIEYPDHFDIIDYKLKNIDDEAYNMQLKGYQEYLNKITDKEIHIYLYSLMDGIYKEIV